MSPPTFAPGPNIAMKIPRADYDAAVAFYRDVLGLEVDAVEATGAPTVSSSHKVRFGAATLWLDCVDNYSQTDLWLELHTDELDEAIATLAAAAVRPCDEVEPLPGPDVRSHWIRNPAGVVHLLAERAVAERPGAEHRTT